MNVRAADLQPGMEVLRGLVASPDNWVELADPALNWSSGGGWVELCYADGSCSRPMQALHMVEIRSASTKPGQ